jgi:hypothetical protein
LTIAHEGPDLVIRHREIINPRRKPQRSVRNPHRPEPFAKGAEVRMGKAYLQSLHRVSRKFGEPISRRDRWRHVVGRVVDTYRYRKDPTLREDEVTVAWRLPPDPFFDAFRGIYDQGVKHPIADLEYARVP